MVPELAAASTLTPAERAALYTAAYEGYLLPFQVDEPTLLFMEHAFDVVPDASFVAREDGDLVGLANLALRGADAWVGGVGVVPARRGCGLGEALMHALVDEARSRGVERLWLEVIVENTPALRLYEKLGWEHVRDVEVWSLAGQGPPSDDPAAGAPLDKARDWIRAHHTAREPWQRAEATVDRLTELEPPPRGVIVDGGAAVVRLATGRVNVARLAGEPRPVLEAVRGLGETVSLVNLPVDDRAAVAFRELGGEVVVRQHELVLELGA